MFQYRQVLLRLRQGDSERDIARVPDVNYFDRPTTTMLAGSVGMIFVS